MYFMWLQAQKVQLDYSILPTSNSKKWERKKESPTFPLRRGDLHNSNVEGLQLEANYHFPIINIHHVLYSFKKKKKNCVIKS